MRPTIAFLVLVLVSPVAGEEARPPTAADIKCAMDVGVAWLKSKQRPDGSWGPCRQNGNCHLTAPTSLAVFALAKCGVPRSDRTIRKALKWLRDFQRNCPGQYHKYTSWELSSIVLAVTEVNRSRKRIRTTRNRHIRPVGSRFEKADWRWMIDQVDAAGYYDEGGLDLGDLMFASLAKRAAAREGYPVHSRTWSAWARDLFDTQDKNGGFPAGDWTTRGTAEGLATLLICREQLALQKAKQPAWLKEMTDKAYAHLRKHFDPRGSPGYLYAVKLVGMVSQRQEIGGKDWYAQGAQWLLQEQKKDGRWVARNSMKPKDVLGTCFALLFLERPAAVKLVPSGD
jgi:hypothetical protein